MELDFDALGIIACRALHIAACALLLGGLVVAGWVAPASRASQQRLARLAWGALAAVLLTGGAWLVVQAADMADAAPDWGVLRAVLLTTTFGQAMCARAGLSLVLALLLRQEVGDAARRARLIALLAAVAVGTLAATGHGNAEADARLTAGLIVHVLGASAWLGGLLPLLLTLPNAGLPAARRFSWLGLGCVALLLAGAAAQAPLIGGWAALLGTDYGRVISLKLTFLLLLLVLAAANLRITLRRPDERAEATLAAVRRRVVLELILAVCAIAAASSLMQLAPGAHQNVEWPFDWRPSLAAFGLPELRPELVGAAYMVVAALALASLAVTARVIRVPALAVAGLLAMWAVPSFGLLLVPAYPTSFYRSPTDFSATSVLAGARLYPGQCAGCHGVAGLGDGPRATGMSDPPADLTAAHLWDHTDGELFWWLSHGMRDPQGAEVMPGVCRNPF